MDGRWSAKTTTTTTTGLCYPSNEADLCFAGNLRSYEESARCSTNGTAASRSRFTGSGSTPSSPKYAAFPLPRPPSKLCHEGGLTRLRKRQFTIIGVLAGVLALAAPAILAIAVPSFMTVIFGILCILVGALQLWGCVCSRFFNIAARASADVACRFWGVYREKALSFRKYVSVNIGLIGLTILYTLAVIILSATRHTQAVDSCVTQFIYNANNSTGTANGNGVISGQKLCNIWTWAQLGVCGLLFLLVAASEVYFCLSASARPPSFRPCADGRRSGAGLGVGPAT